MTRVSENSNAHSLHFALSKTKKKMEDLQLKGTSLRSMTRPSDNPISNVEALALQSRIKDDNQYIRNAEYAELQLNATEKSIEQITEILNKAKEIAIAQSSDLYDEKIKSNIAHEVRQLKYQALAIANRRVGNRYLFGGFKSLSKPFDENGIFKGDQGVITLEVAKDFFVPINLNGYEVFYSENNTSHKSPNPFREISPKEANPNNIKESDRDFGRDLASLNDSSENAEETLKEKYQERTNIFRLLDGLTNSLENNDSTFTQDLLEKFDESATRLITMRTRIGSVMKSIESSKVNNEDESIDAKSRKSALVDADITELFSDLTKQQNILKTSYKASQGLLNKSLIDFLH